MLSGANAFEISDIEKMNIGAHQPGVQDVTTLQALWLPEITIRQGQEVAKQKKPDIFPSRLFSPSAFPPATCRTALRPSARVDVMSASKVKERTANITPFHEL
jgi:hypothetical protein